MTSVLGINLTIIFFLLIPGLVALKAFLRTFVKLDNLSRLDKLVLGVILGGLTLGASLFLLNINCWTSQISALASGLPEYTQWGDSEVWCQSGDVVTISTLQSTPLFVLLSLVMVESVSAAVVFGLLGYIFNRLSDGPPRKPKFIEQPWEYVSGETIREEESATVITHNGEEIEGVIYRIGSPSEDYDLLLSEPKQIYRNNEGDVTNKRPLGSYSYHHYRDISQVQFRHLGSYPEEEPPEDGEPETAEQSSDGQQTEDPDSEPESAADHGSTEATSDSDSIDYDVPDDESTEE